MGWTCALKIEQIPQCHHSNTTLSNPCRAQAQGRNAQQLLYGPPDCKGRWQLALSGSKGNNNVLPFETLRSPAWRPPKVAVLSGASRPLVSPSANLLDFKTRNHLTQVKLPLMDPIVEFHFLVSGPTHRYNFLHPLPQTPFWEA